MTQASFCQPPNTNISSHTVLIFKELVGKHLVNSDLRVTGKVLVTGKILANTAKYSS